MERGGTNSTRQKEFRLQKSLVKTLLIVFVTTLPELPAASLFLTASQ
jgi:hypothetical protein